MNVIKVSIIFILIPFFCFSQSKDQDAYFVLNKDHKEYKLIITEYKSKITQFSLYNRKQYENRGKLIEKNKNEGKDVFYSDYKRPHSYLFRVKNNKKEVITHCNLHQLNIINYEWLIYNSWKENNPNILFKDLYFLLKIEKGKYIKYKVSRTVVAY
ncbi:hypothetical protein [uncultured Polaribacter sp.]|uniref:hypothetical protein n=1 Tax=uncultured Polaribacter sp. TaxID=174711 RepID=UPI0026368C21|nr:hypothetical protein [uncultured Polaribacter sp.]